MSFLQILITSIKGMFPGFLIWTVLPMIPFIIAEQRWPVGTAPRLRDYSMNILISLCTQLFFLFRSASPPVYGVANCATFSLGNRSPSHSATLAPSQSSGPSWKS